MGSNRAVRQELERIYGHICMMHEGLHINGYKKTKTNYKGRSIANQLTLHHIKPKSQGGKATIENGAVLCRACHDYLEQSSPREKAELNRKLQEYKRAKIELTDDIQLPFEIDMGEISIEDERPVVKKLSKKEKKRELRKQRKKEKKEMQRLKNFYEDR